MANVLDMDAIAIHTAIKNKSMRSYDIVKAYIQHIKKVNPFINALVEDRFVEALIEAEEKDQNRSKFKTLPPLYGVPITIKESINVAQLKTTGGLKHRQDLISRHDAMVVKKLKDAGAIILGKTNTPALCFCQETDNKLYGRTNNPWNLTYTAGGSSGGEGALLAVGGAAAGIGSDIGGSIRIPSHFNGIIGFKPGAKQVALEGHFPNPEIPLQSDMLSIGPMGKSVRDMECIYSIIQENDYPSRSLRDFKLEFMHQTTSFPLSKETIQCMKQVAQFLNNSFPTKEAEPPFFNQTASLWQDTMAMVGSKLIEQEAFNNDRSNVFTSFFKEKITERSQVHPYLSWAIVGSKLFKPNPKKTRDVEAFIKENKGKVETYLEQKILVLPVYHSVAKTHGKVYQEIFSLKKTLLQYMPFIAYANVWGLPTLTIPISSDAEDMPIALQLVSATENEDALFSLGKIIEKRFRGYVRCQNYD